MEKFFKIKERGSSLSTEIIGGLTTFLTMSYIIFVNPGILEAAGIPFPAALTATCLGAAIMTILMGLIANRPIALASGMGLNAIVAFVLCGAMGLDWRVAMSIVFLEGIVILLLVVLGLREAIMRAIPVDLRRAIGAGIGLFIAFIGLKGAGIIVSNADTLLAFGDITSKAAIVGFIAIFATAILKAYKVKGDLLWGILIATIVSLLWGPVGNLFMGRPLGLAEVFALKFDFGLDFGTFFAPFQQVPGGGMAITKIFTPVLLVFMFSILMSDFFDTMGTVVAVGEEAGFVDKEGNVEDVKPIFIVDSIAAAFGGLIGASSITSYIESGAGVADGARTGLSNIVIGVLFLLAAFLSPVIGLVPAAATSGALVIVGFLMMNAAAEISWDEFEVAFPAFLILVMIPLTYSITNGIGAGFITYVIIKVCRGKFSDIHPLMWVAAIAFLVAFLQTPITTLLG